MVASSSPRGSRTAPRAPVVGVTPCLDPGRRIRSGTHYLYLNRSYVRALATAGAVPILLPPDALLEACLALCDGLLLTGGGDLPARFDAAPASESPSPGPPEDCERVARERKLLQAFADADRPVLGVCFGMQLMNLHFGGSLITDLSRRATPTLDHGGQERSVPHSISVAPDSAFFSGWKPPACLSSAHGQAVDEIASGFRRAARSSDGVIEAIERGPLVGVQWHPESDDSGEDVYQRFVRTCTRGSGSSPKPPPKRAPESGRDGA